MKVNSMNRAVQADLLPALTLLEIIEFRQSLKWKKWRMSDGERKYYTMREL